MDFACCHCKKISKKSSNLISTGVQNSLYRFVNATWYSIDVKLYIDSEDSTIKIEGGPSDVLHLLVCAIAQILKSYFPDDFERQMGWASGLLYNTIRALKEEDDDED